MFRASTHPVVLSEVDPADGTAVIQQKLGRSRHIVTVNTSAGVNQIIALDCFSLRIGKNCKRVSGLLAQVARLFGSINADCNRADACLVEFVQTLLNAP